MKWKIFLARFLPFSPKAFRVLEDIFTCGIFRFKPFSMVVVEWKLQGELFNEHRSGRRRREKDFPQIHHN
jgi:hypothetical protein